MSFLHRAALYFHTLRYLKPVQIWGRLAFRLHTPRTDLRPAPQLRPMTGKWAWAAKRRPAILAERKFSFLNEARDLAVGEWNPADASPLWLYNLHYFDDLNAAHSEDRREWHDALLASWIRENPPGKGVGWEPYPVSRRIVNWIKWGLAGGTLDESAQHSLAIQARWLEGRIEWHLLGNHLFSNAKALVFAGVYFQGAEAERWLARGLSILSRELPEQILGDGGHFERSTMYHALAVEDVLDLMNVVAAYPGAVPERWQAFIATWPEVVTRMRRWLRRMCHPDGEIAFFNDAAIGITPSLSDIEAYAERLGAKPIEAFGAGLLRLAKSGYLRLHQGPAVAILDAAPLGPDYLPGHAHADTLSFELSIHGHRLVVNSGTSLYSTGAERQRQRGTAAHSTVTVNGEDSSEVWAGFRVARRARPFDTQVEEAADALRVACAHDGYRRLPGRPVHRREWRMSCRGLRILDRIEGECRQAVARFHLHPEVQIQCERSAESGVLTFGSGEKVGWRVQGGEARVVPSTYHPEFGLTIPNQCIEVMFSGDACEMEFLWD